jgi:hypothetical protein
MKNLTQGAGINDGKYPTKVNGVKQKTYILWVNMLNRCYRQKTKDLQPTYDECTVSNNFKYYTYFFEWCNKQIGFETTDYQLDKDLLDKGNKIYSEDTCLFIPSHINKVLTKRQLDRGLLPIGVIKHGNNYQAQCSTYGIRKCIGTFNTPELAFNAYKAFKEAHIKELAEKYKDTIDPRAYQALLNYEVDIND